MRAMPVWSSPWMLNITYTFSSSSHIRLLYIFSYIEGDSMTQQADMAPIVEKVRKLLALSTSSNPHEAALAAAKAQNLLAQYNLELSQIDQDKQTRYEQTTVSAGRHVWRRHLYY